MSLDTSVADGSGIPDFVVNNVVVSSGGTDTPPMGETSSVDSRATSDIAVLPTTVADSTAPEIVTAEASEPTVVAPFTPPSAETTTDFEDLIGTTSDTNVESAVNLPTSVADIAEDYPEEVAQSVVTPTVPETTELETPIVSGLDSVTRGLTSVAPASQDLISEGVAPEAPAGGLNAVVPTGTASDLSPTKEFKATDIIKPLVASAGNLLKSSVTKSLMPAKKPAPKPVGGLQAVNAAPKTSAPPPRQMDVSKLIPVQKAPATKKPVAPPRTLASNANLSPVTNIAGLTSLVKKTG